MTEKPSKSSLISDLRQNFISLSLSLPLFPSLPPSWLLHIRVCVYMCVCADRQSRTGTASSRCRIPGSFYPDAPWAWQLPELHPHLGTADARRGGRASQPLLRRHPRNELHFPSPLIFQNLVLWPYGNTGLLRTGVWAFIRANRVGTGWQSEGLVWLMSPS